MPRARPRWRTRRTRRRLLIASGALAVSIALLALWGCTTTIIPPPSERVASDPVRVFLADHGRHSSILLPLDDDGTRMVEYAYGEWRWFALDESGIFHAPRAMLARSTGTLGRRHVGGPFEEDHLSRFLRLESIYTIIVHRDDAARLRRSLEKQYGAHPDTMVYSERYAMHFVQVDEAYTLRNNCNPVTGRWLEELGCELRGPAIFSSWRVRE